MQKISKFPIMSVVVHFSSKIEKMRILKSFARATQVKWEILYKCMR